MDLAHNYIDELELDRSCLQAKKEQTTKKIEYIRTYVEQWLYVWVQQGSTKSVTFIDAMCNAGIYKDGGLGTAAEVCKLFASFAKEHPSIEFGLYVNDYNEKRMNTCVSLCNYLAGDLSNLLIVYANKDVNEFLDEAGITTKVPRGFGNAVLLFVDPYNARTVHLSKLSNFIKSRYCEVIFNWFSSDLTRNKNDKSIWNCFDDLIVPEDHNVTDEICNALRVGSMKYSFSYSFRIQNNAELYQIIFVTPSPAGLEKLKDALWATFHGEEHHRNRTDKMRTLDSGQTCLFSDKTMDDLRAESYSHDACELVMSYFAGREHVGYEEISNVLLEQTMLRSGQFLAYVIKPMIAGGILIKDGTTRKNNYSKDTYSFPSE